MMVKFVDKEQLVDIAILKDDNVAILGFDEMAKNIAINTADKLSDKSPRGIRWENRQNARAQLDREAAEITRRRMGFHDCCRERISKINQPCKQAKPGEQTYKQAKTAKSSLQVSQTG